MYHPLGMDVREGGGELLEPSSDSVGREGRAAHLLEAARSGVREVARVRNAERDQTALSAGVRDLRAAALAVGLVVCHVVVVEDVQLLPVVGRVPRKELPLVRLEPGVLPRLRKRADLQC